MSGGGRPRGGDGVTNRTRRATIAFAVIALVAATVVFAANGPLHFAATEEHPPPQSPSTGSGSPRPTLKLTAVGSRADRHLREVLPRLVPGATDIEATGFVQAYPDDEKAADLATSVVNFRDDAGPARFNVTITGPVAGRELMPPLGTFCTAPAFASDGTALRCEKLQRPDGATLIIRETAIVLTGAGTAGRIDELDAILYRADGSTVNIINSAIVPDQPTSDPRSRLPLTEQQLLVLVTDPEFTLG
jgi:hypothetical protein